MDANKMMLEMMTKMMDRLEALENKPAASKASTPRKAKGKAKGKARKVDHRTANEREASKVMKRIEWHESRIRTLGKAIKPGQLKWNNAMIAELTDKLATLRAHAARHGETLPESVKAAKVKATMARKAKGKARQVKRSGLVDARTGDTYRADGVIWTLGKGGWWTSDKGDKARTGKLAS